MRHENGLRRTGRWVALMLCWGTLEAQANESAKIAANATFEEGKRLMAASQFAEACPKFLESQRIEPASGTLLWLGECYEKLGKTASAWSTYKSAAGLAATQGKADREKIARDKIASLEPRLLRLTLRVATPLPGLTLMLDGTTFGEAIWNTALPVDPGEHDLLVKAPKKVPKNLKISVEKDTSFEVPALEDEKAPVASPTQSAKSKPPPPPVASATATPPGAPPAPPPREPAKRSDLSTVGYALGSAGLVVFGSGLYLQIDARSKAAKANGVDRTAFNDAGKQQTTALLTMGVGGALLLSGVVLLLVTPSESSPSTSLHLTPAVGTSAWGLNLGGSL